MEEDVLGRYTIFQRGEILSFFAVLAMRTRKSKRISKSRVENIVKTWEPFDIEVVMATLKAFVEMETTTQNEHYVLGIMRNKQSEVSIRARDRRGSETNTKSNRSEKQGNEGERLRELIARRGIKREELNCDF